MALYLIVTQVQAVLQDEREDGKDEAIQEQVDEKCNTESADYKKRVRAPSESQRFNGVVVLEAKGAL